MGKAQKDFLFLGYIPSKYWPWDIMVTMQTRGSTAPWKPQSVRRPGYHTALCRPPEQGLSAAVGTIVISSVNLHPANTVLFHIKLISLI